MRVGQAGSLEAQFIHDLKCFRAVEVEELEK